MDRARNSALREGAEEEAVEEEGGCCRPTGSQSPWVGPCPGPAGDGLGTSGGEAPRVEGPGAAPLGRSGEEQGEAGWLEAAAGLEEEGWEAEGSPAGLWRVTGEVEGGEGEAAEEECWS